MNETTFPGLTADWLNGWLAALGVAVLLPDRRVGWTQEPLPKARIGWDGDADIPGEIAEGLGGRLDLGELVIAREHPSASAPLPRNVSVDAYRERARLARVRRDPFLAACLTDLGVLPDGTTEHSPFDRPAPRGETLHDRVVRCWGSLKSRGDVRETVLASLHGRAWRIKANGLGFDHRRLPAAVANADLTVDPVVELLAFFALTLFPVRGDGARVRTRGWTNVSSRRGAFTWPVWSSCLDRHGIDALLDRWYSGGKRSAVYGVFGSYQTVPYRPKGAADVTRAYAAERVW